MAEAMLHKLKEGSSHRLVCFPYLGGYASSYFDLSQSFGDEVEVWGITTPGHANSTLQPVVSSQELVSSLVTELGQLANDRETVFYGHSMGGIMAYFVAQALRRNTSDYPHALLLTACNAPCEFQHKQESKLSDELLLKRVQSLSEESSLSSEESALMRHFLPTLRADFQLLEDFSSLDFEPMDIVSHYLYAELDKAVNISSAGEWLPYFKNGMTFQMIPKKGHMFVKDSPEFIASYLSDNIFKIPESTIK